MPGVPEVSLFVRLWVEINWKNRVCKDTGRSASSWGCELKWFMGRIPQFGSRSASSWGCELKYYENYTGSIAGAVSLFVRLWVEILRQMWWSWTMIVSLFVRLWVEIILLLPRIFYPRSASSWGCELKLNCSCGIFFSLRSASSWGCELKWHSGANESVPATVSLFVRLWVEITHLTLRFQHILSASSWGCELKLS